MTQLVSRRSLLRGTIAAAAALSLVGAVRLPAAVAGAHVLSARETRIVASVARVLFPAGAFPVDGVEAGVVEEVDRILGEDLPGMHAAAFRYMLRALEWGSLAGHGRPFSSLSPGQQHEVLSVWSEPGILPRRIAFDALKAVFAMAYFANPVVLDAMGYRAACGGVLA